jgi:peptidoglycan/xylan/chitin deacetylase (PgdA/CDA1 family)
MESGLARTISSGKRASLLIVNYHRLWPLRGSDRSQFDDGVFGPDVEAFGRQLAWLRSATTVLDETGLLELCSRDGGRRGELYSAVTFDDAYIDCYSLAKPVLDSLGIRGIFFVPVEMIDSRQLGWWDLAAYILKQTQKHAVSVAGQTFDLKSGFAASLRHILNLFKLRPMEETSELLAELSRTCEVAPPGKDAQSAELMTWKQLREMRAAGHGIGSHTFSHRVLATLPPEEQEREIKGSRSELGSRIGVSVMSFAYPVGGPQHIDRHSVAFARQAGYEQAFTFNTGVADLPIPDRYRIPRESANSLDVLKAKVLMPGLMGLREKRVV